MQSRRLVPPPHMSAHCSQSAADPGELLHPLPSSRIHSQSSPVGAGGGSAGETRHSAGDLICSTEPQNAIQSSHDNTSCPRPSTQSQLSARAGLPGVRTKSAMMDKVAKIFFIIRAYYCESRPRSGRSNPEGCEGKACGNLRSRRYARDGIAFRVVESFVPPSAANTISESLLRLFVH